MTRIARISFSCHLMKPDEPDGWRNDYLVNPVCLVIKFKKKRRADVITTATPQTIQNEKRILLCFFPCI